MVLFYTFPPFSVIVALVGPHAFSPLSFPCRVTKLMELVPLALRLFSSVSVESLSGGFDNVLSPFFHAFLPLSSIVGGLLGFLFYVFLLSSCVVDGGLGL